MNDKKTFVEETLARVISEADQTISGLTLTDGGEMVGIHYNDGGKARLVSIWGDSRLAIIGDVVRECLR